MTKVADFFQPRLDSPTLDPRLREWKSYLDQGMTAGLAIDWTMTGFGQTQPRMSLQFTKDNRSARPDESLPWDDDLNAGLIKFKIRAEDVGQESDRFSLSLDTAFSAAERVAGNGFFNSVLFDYIQESDLADNEVIAALLRGHSVVTLDRQSPKYARCREMIDMAIRGRALELKDDLGYSMDQAWEILVAALARYIDRRFSVSIRRQRGLL